MKKLLYLGAMLLVFAGCSVENTEEAILDSYDSKIKAQNNKASFEIPTISQPQLYENSLKLEITAGSTGATGGLSIRWMTKEAYEQYGWDNDLGCHVQLTANPSNNNYELGENESFIFYLENYLDEDDLSGCNRELTCGLSYMFIVQAHGDGQIRKSGYSTPLEFSTTACEMICPYGKGYWRNHSVEENNPGNQGDRWAGTGYENNMTLGYVTYDRDQLDMIFDMNNSEGNGIVNFSQHLIAAKLNYAIGVRMDGIEQAIEAADALIGTKNIFDGDSFDADDKTDSASIKEIITTFNDLCSEEE